MRVSKTLIAGFAALLLASGCNNAKSPDAAARDVAAASQSAAQEVDKAQHELAKDVNNDAYDVMLARADGDRKVAIHKCEFLQGSDQKACKDQANADYDAAKASAKADRVAQRP